MYAYVCIYPSHRVVGTEAIRIAESEARSSLGLIKERQLISDDISPPGCLKQDLQSLTGESM